MRGRMGRIRWWSGSIEWDRPSPSLACHASAKPAARQTTETDRLSHSNRETETAHGQVAVVEALVDGFDALAGERHAQNDEQRIEMFGGGNGQPGMGDRKSTRL